MPSTATTKLRYFLGCLYILEGTYKLLLPPGDLISQVYTDWANLSIFAAAGFNVNPVPFMNAISLLGVAFGTLLLLGTQLFQKLACGIMLFINISGLHSMILSSRFVLAFVPVFQILLLVYIILTIEEEKPHQA